MVSFRETVSRTQLAQRCFAKNGNSLLLYWGPARIGVELGHCGCCLCCISSQILLQQVAVLIDDESHHAGVAVLSWIGDEGEAAGHLSIDDIVLGKMTGGFAFVAY